VSPNAAFVSPEAALMLAEVAFVWQSAAFACQVISVTASIASFVWHIAALHSPGAGLAIRFARVASASAAYAVGFVADASRFGS
jgi:hypothetical protein